MAGRRRPCRLPMRMQMASESPIFGSRELRDLTSPPTISWSPFPSRPRSAWGALVVCSWRCDVGRPEVGQATGWDTAPPEAEPQPSLKIRCVMKAPFPREGGFSLPVTTARKWHVLAGLKTWTIGINVCNPRRSPTTMKKAGMPFPYHPGRGGDITQSQADAPAV